MEGSANTAEFKNDYLLGFIICEIFTVIALQDWVGWGIFAVIPGSPRRANGHSQHLEALPELQDWLGFELFTAKNYRTGPFSKELGNNFELGQYPLTQNDYLRKKIILK